ncbi:MAG: DNA-directed RNA polymerase subunit beta [Gammaproteobacteria bacterium]
MAQTPRQLETKRLHRVLMQVCDPEKGGAELPAGADAAATAREANNALNAVDLEKLRAMMQTIPRLARNERRRLMKYLRGIAEDAGTDSEELRAQAQKTLSDESASFSQWWAIADKMLDVAPPKKAAGWQPSRQQAEWDVAVSAMDTPITARSTLRAGRVLSYAEKRRPRRSFARHGAQAEIPPLMQLQKQSFVDFLQRDIDPEKREMRGLESAFHSVFPIESSSGAVILHFKQYELRPPVYTVPECKLRGLTYQSAVYADISMEIREKKGGATKEFKEEKVYMGELPLMTDDGSFVINGTERVVVSQLHRSPGVLFEHDSGRNTSGGKYLYSARIIPYNGSWLDFEFDKRDILYFRIDRKRKMPATILLKALGYDKTRILREFYDAEEIRLGAESGRAEYRLRGKFLRNVSLDFDLCDPSRREKMSLADLGDEPTPDKLLARDAIADGEVVARAREFVNPAEMRDAGAEEIYFCKVLVQKQHRIKKIDLRRLEPLEGEYHPVGDSFLYGRRLAEDVRPRTPQGAPIDAAFLDALSSELGRRLPSDIVADGGEVLAREGDVIDRKMLDSFHEEDKTLPPRKFAADFHWETAYANTEIDQTLLDGLRKKSACAEGALEIKTLYVNEFDHGDFVAKTLALDETLDEGKSRETIYRILRPGDPPNREVVNNHLDAILCDSATYNMSRVGRMKFNRRLHPGAPEREYGGRAGYRREYFPASEKRPAMEYKVLVREESARLAKADAAAAAAALARSGCFVDEESAADYLAYIRQFTPRRAIAENLSPERAEEIRKTLEGALRVRVDKQTTPSSLDILTVIKYLVALRDGKEKADDIDNLSNRRVRAVGEFIANQFEQGLLRVNRAIRDRLSRAETDNLMPHNLISAKAVSSAVAEFFNGNQLSQFMDQTNPLAEITHKRRVSAFGVGGLNRDRVGFEVRDVHPSHYGRICPIETPEGPNIGLINSMSLYAEADEYGFLRTPYVEVRDGAATEKVERLSAIDEQGRVIAQASNRRDGDGRFTEALVTARRDGEFILCAPGDVDYVDIAPAQIASVAASLIPFLEHDDANRALMGSNMQRQGVPCLYPEKPLVGTGLERLVVRGSGSVVQARRGGTVSYVDADRVAVRVADKAIRSGESGVDIYHLTRYTRSNQNTNISHRPVVRDGDVIAAGDVIADGAATDMGEVALGQNLLVAFMPWNGYNYEDSILVSEKVAAEQRFASIHIIEEVAHARSTQLGDEDITRDIPHQSETSVVNLDDEGIVHVGVHVKPGDILVGKITPKGERQLTPEEKLLQAVFGDKAKDVKDTSLRMPPGSSGVVIDVKVFDSDEIKKRDKGDPKSPAGRRIRSILDSEMREFKRDQAEAWRIIEEDARMRIRALAEKKTSAAAVGGIGKGDKIDAASLASLKREHFPKLRVTDAAANEQIRGIENFLKSAKARQAAELKEQTRKMTDGHPLPQGILKTIKVYVAIKRNLQVGDKMAGRHGNKGVVSKIVPVESMPYLRDGTPVDVVLSPLGVPSRMNVGQILETHLGLAAKGLGAKIQEMLRLERGRQISELRAFLRKVYAEDGGGFNVDDLSDDEVLETAANLQKGVPFATPIFDGAGEDDIRKMLELGGLPPSGQMTLYDGYSGEPFERPVTVGYMYILKLHHLVDEKMHARSTGPYSLITQQPLGGKAQRGGQRFGEMEVWALEAYGAAYTLREMLTVKSDDIANRTKMFEAIAEGDLKLKAGVPESFNVLVQEIRALGIDMDFE